MDTGLKPTLIQYSSPKHRQGIRKYFEGQYKIDYGFVKQKQWKREFLEMKHIDKIRHTRSQTCSLDQYRLNKFHGKDNTPAKLYHSRFHTQGEQNCSLINRQNQKVQKSNAKLNLGIQSIQLPRISKINLNPEDSLSNKHNKHRNIKSHLYICGNQKCQTKGIPIKEQQKVKKRRSKTYTKGKRLIQIKPMPSVRVRYTPTFVCSKDNPLPCFKIYDKYRSIQQTQN